MLEDISGDSFPEFVIVMNNSENMYDQPENIRIYDMYRLKDGIPERIFDINSMGYRSVYTICENGFVKCRGSGGAAASADIIYRLEGDSETVYQCVEHDGVDGVPKYFLSDAGHNNTQMQNNHSYRLMLI